MFKRYWWIFPISVFVCSLFGLLVGGILTFIQPKQYESTTVLQVRPRAISLDLLSGDRDPAGTGPTFFPTEFEVIKSQKTLDVVIDDLDLLTRWNSDRDTVRQQLSENIHAQNIRESDLIEIRVHAASPEEAQSIAKKLTAAYTERRGNLEAQRTEQAFTELRNVVQKQEAVVEEKRKALTTIIRNQELIYRSQTRNESDAYPRMLEQKIMLEGQIETLLRYDDDQLMTYAAGLQLPENIIRTLYPQYLEANRTLTSLQLDGLGDAHPNIKRQKETVEGLRRDLDEGVIALREALRAQLDLITEKTARLKDNRGTMLLGPSRKDQLTMSAFEEAKAEFETAQRLLEQLKIKLIAEEIQHRIVESPIIMHAEPFFPTKPIYPHLLRNLIIGLLSGLAIGIIAPFLIKP